MKNSSQGKFKQNKGFYASQEYQDPCPKTTEKKISKLEPYGQEDKKETVRKVLAEITTEYDFKCDITASPAESPGIEQQVAATGIITLDEIVRFIEIINKNSIIRFNSYKRSPLYIKDEELRYIDELIDDRIINLY